MPFILIFLLGCLRKSVFMAKLLREVFVVQIHGVENNSKYIGFRGQTIFPKYFLFNLRNRMIIEKATEKRHHITLFEIFSRLNSISQVKARPAFAGFPSRSAFLTQRLRVIGFISCGNSILSNMRSLTMPSVEVILFVAARHARSQANGVKS